VQVINKNVQQKTVTQSGLGRRCMTRLQEFTRAKLDGLSDILHTWKSLLVGPFAFRGFSVLFDFQHQR